MRRRALPLLAVPLWACVNASTGRMGNADFTYASCVLGCPLDDHALAAGGARATINVSLHQGVPAIAMVASANPEVVTFARGANANEVAATSGTAGAADLILYDASGKIFERALVTVKEATVLDVDRGWGDLPGPTVLAATNHVLHLMSRAGSEVLVGGGAVRFAVTGGLRAGMGAPVDLYLGDFFAFSGSGDGSVVATAGSAKTTIPVTVVPAAALGSPELSPTSLTLERGGVGRVTATVRAGAAPVFGADCTWSTTPGLGAPSVNAGGLVTSTPTTTWQFAGTNPGQFAATCTIPGAHNATVAVRVN